MQFVCNHEHISPRLKYTIDFIFSTLGFNVDIVSSKKFKKLDELIIGYLNIDELQLYKNINLINIANFDELNNLEKFEKNIEIKKVNSEDIPVLGKTCSDEENNTWKKSKKNNYFYYSDSNIWQLEYDIISSFLSLRFRIEYKADFVFEATYSLAEEPRVKSTS